MTVKFTNEISGAAVPTWLQFHFLVRVALLVQASTTVSLAWHSPFSLTARLIEIGGVPAQWVLCAMTAALIVGLADALINDVLPQRFSLQCVRRNRHIGYMLLGATYLIQAFAGLADAPSGAGILLGNYVATGIGCGAFALAATLRPSHAL